MSDTGQRVVRAAAFLAIGAVQYAVIDGTPAERAGPAVLLAGAFVWARPLARRMRARATDADRQASWRNWENGRPRRWRGGFLRRRANALVMVPMLGKTGPALPLASVRDVAVRDVARREWLSLSRDARVLEVTHEGGRLDLAVLEDDVEIVRGWLVG